MDPHAAELRRLMEAQEDIRLQAELEVRTSDGSLAPTLFSLRPVPLEEERLVSVVVTDLSEQRRAQEVAASEALNRAVIEHSADGIIVTDCEGRIILANSAAVAIAGKDLIDQPLTEALDLTLADAAEWRTLLGRDAVTAVPALLQNHIGRRHVLLSTAPLNQEAGCAAGCTITLTAVTAVREAERALAESEERYRTIGELMPYGVWLTDAEGNNYYTSRSLLDLMGITQEEWTGKRWAEMIHPDDGPSMLAAWETAVAAGDLWSYEFRVRGADGNYHWILGRGIPRHDPDGNLTGYIGVNIDIRDVKQAQQEREQALHQAQRERALLEALIAQMPGGFLAVRPPGMQVLLCNEVFESYMGDSFPPGSDVIQNTTHVLLDAEGNPLTPEQWPLYAALVEGEVTEGGEYTLDTSFGRRNLVVYVRPVHESDGTIIAGVLTFLDITERRVAQDELRRHRDHLEDLVVERTRELSEANELLEVEVGERRMAEEQLLRDQEALRSFASELALTEERERRLTAVAIHDSVGQTLAFTRMKLKMLMTNWHDTDHASDLRTMDEMLAQAIAETRSLTLDLSPPVLYSVGFEAAVEWLGERAHEKHGVTVHFHNDLQPKPLREDLKIILFQAARELINNAAKHARAANIYLCVSRRDTQIELQVADDGIGFKPTQIELGGEGDSFGLFNIHERLTHMGGLLDIDSRPGRGARFTLVAPLDIESGDSSS